MRKKRLLMLCFVCLAAVGLFMSCESWENLVMSYLMEKDPRPGEIPVASAVERFPSENAGIPGKYPPGSPVARHGKLGVTGTQLRNERGDPVQLRGLFIRALKSEGKFINAGAVSWFANTWKIDVIRVMLLPEGADWGGAREPGYLAHPELENLIHDAIRITEAAGLYCIVDWHVMIDGDPNAHRAEARDFFKRLAYRYGAKKHVLYEICNEPNGVKWSLAIKPYAEHILPAVRAGDPDSIIIVGTEAWCADLRRAAAEPLPDPNVMYAVHFYAGSHPFRAFSRQAGKAIREIPVICTEWGIVTGQDPCGPPYFDRARNWLDFLNTHGISWCYYSLSDVPETTSIFKPQTRPEGGWNDRDFTPSGLFIRDYFLNR